jgi:hypothetical protein
MGTTGFVHETTTTAAPEKVASAVEIPVASSRERISSKSSRVLRPGAGAGPNTVCSKRLTASASAPDTVATSLNITVDPETLAFDRKQISVASAWATAHAKISPTVRAIEDICLKSVIGGSTCSRREVPDVHR